MTSKFRYIIETVDDDNIMDVTSTKNISNLSLIIETKLKLT